MTAALEVRLIKRPGAARPLAVRVTYYRIQPGHAKRMERSRFEHNSKVNND